jgi:hypothetical protein
MSGESVRKIINTVAYDPERLRQLHAATRERRRPVSREEQARKQRLTKAQGRPRAPTYTDDDLLKAMIIWRKRHGEPVSVKRWDTVRDPELPSALTISKRFGTWNAAKDLVGLNSYVAEGRKYTRRYTKESTLDLVVQYEQERRNRGLARGNYSDFEEWCRIRKRRLATVNTPSAATVRQLHGSWTSVHQLALDVIANQGKP